MLFGKKEQSSQVIKAEDKTYDVKSEQFVAIRDDLDKMIASLVVLAESVVEKHNECKQHLEDCLLQSQLTKKNNNNCRETLASLDNSIEHLKSSIGDSFVKLDYLSQLVKDFEKVVSSISAYCKSIDSNCSDIKSNVDNLNSVIDSEEKIISVIDIDFDKFIEFVQKVRDIANSTTTSIEKLDKLSVNAMIEATRAEQDSDKFKIVAKEITKLTDTSSKSNKELLDILDYMLNTFTEASNSKKSFTKITSDKNSSNKSISDALNCIETNTSSIRQALDDLSSIIKDLDTRYNLCLSCLNLVDTSYNEVVSAVNTHDTDLENCSTSLTSLINIIDLTNKHFEVLGTSIDLTNTRCTNLVDISKKLKEL